MLLQEEQVCTVITKAIQRRGGGQNAGKFKGEEGGRRKCTCNLTVVNGTPRKECNKTQVKCLEGGGRGRKSS